MDTSAVNADETATEVPPQPRDERRHPRALSTLAFVEFCERFASTGVRVMQVVYLITPVAAGGLGQDTRMVAAVLGASFLLATLSSLIGGFAGDRLLGARRAVAVGSALMAAGMLAALVAAPVPLYIGLGLISIGSGLLRANNLVLLGRAYGDEAPRRMAGFTLYDCAANAGMLLGSVVCGLLADASLWRVGLGAAALAQVVGAAAYLGASGTLDRAGLLTAPFEHHSRRRRVSFLVIALVAAVAGSLAVGIGEYRGTFGLVLLVVVVAARIWFKPWRAHEEHRLRLIFTLCAATAALWFFDGWVGQQSIQSREDFAATTGWGSPSWWFASLGPAVAVLLGPLVATVWSRLSDRGSRPSTVGVVGVGCLLQGFGLLTEVMILRGDLALGWLVTGEIARSLADVLVTGAVLSTLTRLAPIQVAATTIGLWQVTTVVGRLAGADVIFPIVQWSMVGLASCSIVGLLLIALRKRLTDVGGERRPSSRPRWVAVAGYGAAIAVFGVIASLPTPGVARLDAAAGGTPLLADATGARLPSDGTYGFQWMPPSPALIGAEDTDTLASPAERPARAVTLDGFFIGKYEVTVAQYRQCVDENGCRPGDDRATRGVDSTPVRYISWYEALEYCAWLERKLRSAELSTLLSSSSERLQTASARVSLPTEAQWEFVARTADLMVYPWAGPLEPTRANFSAAGRLAPAPIGQFVLDRTVMGVRDMGGNVAEWTRTEFLPYPYDQNDGRDDPDQRAPNRVIRGGSFYDGASLLRTTARRAADPTRGYEFVGFRVAIIAGTSTGAAAVK